MSKVTSPKTVIVNFADGKKEVSIGSRVFSRDGQSGRPLNYEAVVTSIGRTYIGVTQDGCSKEDKFSIETGKEKNDCAPDTLYSSKAAFDLETLKQKLEADVAGRFKYDRAPGVTTEQLLAIQKILNTPKFQMGEFDDLHKLNEKKK